ncbi:acyltransferase [Bordetella genomosp. 12]|uniref:acyltransferase n=1 Tax=Bordetella genomosp. 12 TaxID=463035 RepID=UPI001FC95D2C|nr:acyltransferase [Bordetella genomosp. 12]
MRNYYWISLVKAAAMMGVVGIHVAGYTGVAPGARDTLVGKVAILIATLGLCAVPLFVMVSGALLLDPARFHGVNDFLKKRTLRILVPLVFWHVAYYLFIVFYLGWHLSPLQAVKNAMNGNLYTALYYFWVILGLSVLTPVLIPYVREKNNNILGFGVLACCIPVLSVALVSLRPGQPVWIHTPWTWWIPYLGYFMLGWALKEVVLPRRWSVVAVCCAAVMVLGLYSTWSNSNVSILAAAVWPASYYSLATHLFTISAFLIIKSLPFVRTQAQCRVGARFAQVIGKLGEGTLGVFAMHLIVLAVLLRQEWFGRSPVSHSIMQLLARIVIVYVLTYAIVLALRQAPALRRLL